MVPAGTKTSGLPQKLLSINPKYRKNFHFLLFLVRLGANV